MAGFLVAQYVHQRSKPHVRQTLCYDTSLLGTTENPDGTWSIWHYDWVSDGFEVLAQRSERVRLVEGSTSERVVWNEISGESPHNLSSQRFALSADDRTPVLLDFGSLEEQADTAFVMDVSVKMVQGTSLLVIPVVAGTNPNANALILWDLAEQEERGRIALGNSMAMDPHLSARLGPEKKHIVFYHYDPPRGYFARLCTLDPFVEVASLCFASGFHGISVSKVSNHVVLARPMAYLKLEFGLEPGAEFLRIAGAEGLPERDMTYDSYLEPLTDAVRSRSPKRALDVGEARRNAVAGTWRDGLMFWCTVKPPVMKIAKDGETDFDKVVEVPFPGSGTPHDYFCVSDDGTILVIPSGKNTFRLYEIDFPKVTLFRECRLTYDRESETLSMEVSTEKP